MLESSAASSTGPPSIDVSHVSATLVQQIVSGELERHRALVHISRLQEEERRELAPRASYQPPLIDRLAEFPEGGVDLGHIVELPPKLASIPAKPIFLDVAWNFVDYPQADGQSSVKKNAAAVTDKQQDGDGVAAAETGKPAEQPQRKGWFGLRLGT